MRSGKQTIEKERRGPRNKADLQRDVPKNRKSADSLLRKIDGNKEGKILQRGELRRESRRRK